MTSRKTVKKESYGMKVLVVDLDGTLLHAEPEEISVRGRSGYRYMSKGTGAILARIGEILPVVIATGRNAQSVGRLVEHLGHVRFNGFILENGLVARKRLQIHGAGKDAWAAVMEVLPGWDRLDGYENCLGVIPPPWIQDPSAVLEEALSLAGKTGCLYPERHKLFVYPSLPSKLAGAGSLGIEPYIVLGNDLNDLDILDAASHCATLISAHEQVRQRVRDKGGYCSPLSSHAASENLLSWVVETVLADFITFE